MIWIAAFGLYISLGWYFFEMPEEFTWWQKLFLRVFWLPVVVVLIIAFTKHFKL